MRKLVAALAVRNKSKRLYAKPLQNISDKITILDQIISTLKYFSEIKEIIIGIADSPENIAYIDFCKERKLDYVLGNEEDVLDRLIKCGEKSKATDIFRVSTECPFLWLDKLNEIFKIHLDNQNDITVTDNLPEGTAIEIFKLDTLKYIHQNCEKKYKSEIFTRYPRNNINEFKVKVIEPPKNLQRIDIRLTVDYPEDLTLCRIIYEKFIDEAPVISISKIINFLDEFEELKNLVKNRINSSQTLMWQNYKNKT
jgi:spore coat polysaccharide biosynthesis protein SpsF